MLPLDFPPFFFGIAMYFIGRLLEVSNDHLQILRQQWEIGKEQWQIVKGIAHRTKDDGQAPEDFEDYNRD